MSGDATNGDTRPRCEHGVVYPDDNCVVCLKRDLAAALVEQERLRQGWVGSDKLFLEYRMKEAARSETATPALADKLHGMGDAAYCAAVAMAQNELCLGEEYKIKSGGFTLENLKALEAVRAKFGEANGLWAAEKVVREFAPVSAIAAPACDRGYADCVPRSRYDAANQDWLDEKAKVAKKQALLTRIGELVEKYQTTAEVIKALSDDALASYKPVLPETDCVIHGKLGSADGKCPRC